MVAKSERLKELEAARRKLKAEESREERRAAMVTALVAFHRLEAGAAFAEADRALAHPRSLGLEARSEERELELEANREAIDQERAAIDRAAYAEAERTGAWPDGTPFVRYGGPVVLPPETPAGPPAGEGEAGDAPPAPIPPEPRESDDPDVTPAP